MPTITIRIRLDYAWDKSLHVQKMRVPALQTLADSDNIERSCPFSTTALVPTQSIYDTTYTYDFYDAGTYLDCSVGCYFGVVGASEPIWWSATTQVTIPNL